MPGVKAQLAILLNKPPSEKQIQNVEKSILEIGEFSKLLDIRCIHKKKFFCISKIVI